LAKNYLTKIILAFIVLFSFSSPFLKTIVAKESYSNLFIKITDANTAINNNENNTNNSSEHKSDNNNQEGNKSEDKKYSSLLVIGDSLTVDIGEKIKEKYPGAIIDGKISRQLTAATALADQYANYNNENTAVIFQLGTNGFFTESQVEELVKKFDKAVQPKIKTGLEMLVNNFSLGILGFILSVIGYYGIGPVVKVITNILSAGVDVIVNAHLLPLANIFIEPAKILFLNNAINHGILTPIATEQALNTGKSVLYLLEANPGVGLGILLAYTFFGKGSAKASAPGAALIHFIGGIHEIYFPYILMKPALIIAAMAGGVSGTATFQLLGAGLRAPASPGSIIAVLAQTAQGSYFAVIAGVVVSTAVTFVIASIILRRDKGEADLEAAQSKVSSMKAESKGQEAATEAASENSYRDVKKIIFACDAGMGSSAMGASILRNKVKKAGLDFEVTNVAIRNLTEESGLLIVTQNELTPRAKQMNGKALHVSVDNFLNSPKYDEIVENLQK